MYNYLKLFSFFLLSLFSINYNTTVQAQARIHHPHIIAKNFHNPTNKPLAYKKAKNRLIKVRHLTNKHTIKFHGINYYYANHKFYSYTNGYYTMIRPKIGFRIPRLPHNHVKVHYQSDTYFFYDGIIYKCENNEYEVITPEIGMIIHKLPKDYEKIKLNGKKYYDFYNIRCQKVRVNRIKAYKIINIFEI